MSTINPTIESARLAAEAVREINHRTINPGAFNWPSEAYDTIGELARLLHRLPQALEQIAVYLLAEHKAGRVVADWGSYAGGTEAAINDAVAALEQARHWVEKSAGELDLAHNATAGLSAAKAEA